MTDRPFAIITGGTRGIGAACVRLFLDQGFVVGATCATAESAQLARDAYAADDHRDRVRFVVADVADELACQRAVVELTTWSGLPTSVLINNAGFVDDALVLFQTTDRARRLMDVHYFGVVNMSRAVMKSMISRRAGCIINVVSPAAKRPLPGQAAYAAAKAAVVAHSRVLAQELGPMGLRVVALSPGVTETAMIANLDAAQRQRLLDAVPMGRFATASEIAQNALFLTRASYVSGSVWSVDGGVTA